MNHHRLTGVFGLVLAGAFSAQAAITTGVAFNSTTGAAGITAWPNPYIVTSTSANPGVNFTVGENNYGGASLFSIGQSWTATTSGNLTDIQITISGTAPVSFTVSLFDAGTSGWADISSGTYVPGGNVSANLFTDTSIQTWSGYTLGGANAAVLDFALTGADQVSIVAGRQYIFEISSTSNPNGMVWFRQGATGNYTGGQAFRQRAPLNGNPARDMTIAANVVAVPEPTVAAVFGLGALVLARLRRKQV
jgi:hypothetical protein